MMMVTTDGPCITATHPSTPEAPGTSMRGQEPLGNTGVSSRQPPAITYVTALFLNHFLLVSSRSALLVHSAF